jgi:hypothetical protein
MHLSTAAAIAALALPTFGALLIRLRWRPQTTPWDA